MGRQWPSWLYSGARTSCQRSWLSANTAKPLRLREGKADGVSALHTQSLRLARILRGRRQQEDAMFGSVDGLENWHYPGRKPDARPGCRWPGRVEADTLAGSWVAVKLPPSPSRVQRNCPPCCLQLPPAHHCRRSPRNHMATPTPLPLSACKRTVIRVTRWSTCLARWAAS